jgi:hypothetical protein
VTIGFWWWEKWKDASRQNMLMVWKEGVRYPVATLEEIMTGVEDARGHGQLPEFIDAIVSRIREKVEGGTT